PLPPCRARRCATGTGASSASCGRRRRSPAADASGDGISGHHDAGCPCIRSGRQVARDRLVVFVADDGALARAGDHVARYHGVALLRYEADADAGPRLVHDIAGDGDVAHGPGPADADALVLRILDDVAGDARLGLDVNA